MSENRTVIAFFLGLVIFIVLIGLVVNRIRKPQKSTEAKKNEVVTPSPKPGEPTPTSKPGILSGLTDLFKRKPTPTPAKKPKPTPTIIILGETNEIDSDSPNAELKQGIAQEGVVSHTASISTKGGLSTQTPSVTTIPETGAPTALIPISLLLGGIGTILKGKRKNV